MVRAIAVLFVLAALPQAAWTQEEACTYRTCALRVRQAFMGPEIVQGLQEERIAKISFLAPRVPQLAERSPEAAVRYDSYRRAYNQGFWLTISGFALIGGAWLVDQVEPTATELQLGIGIPGLVLAFAGVIRGFSHRDDLSQAMWYYNATFAR